MQLRKLVSIALFFSYSTASLLSFCNHCHASVFYVDSQHGSDSGDGSHQNPWRSISEVVNNMVETMQPVPGLPYSGDLIVKNENAPIKPGDKIILRDGFYGVLNISRSFNHIPVTITSENKHQAVFSFINITAASNWIIDGVTVNREIGAPDESSGTLPLVRILNGWHGPAKHITIQNCAIHSHSDSSDWTKEDWSRARTGVLSRGAHVNILNNHVKNVVHGIQIHEGGHYSIVKNNVVENFTNDGMQGCASDLLFENNIVKNCLKVNDNHDDGFQSWSIPPNSTGVPNERVILRGNLFIEHENLNHPLRGELQGIGLFDGPYIDWIIENNVIIVGHWHGIAISGGINCRIVNNTVIHAPGGTASNPHIRVSNTKWGQVSENVIVRNNIARNFVLESGAVADHNHTISIEDYGTYFIDHSSNDLRLRQGSPAINSGSTHLAPITDIVGNARPSGGGIDLGAYEAIASLVLEPIGSIHRQAGQHIEFSLSAISAENFPFTFSASGASEP